MKLKNKRSGEIKEFVLFDGKNELQGGATLKDLVKEWEDYEEPKEYWHIFGTNITKTQEGLDKLYDERNKEIGNYFETKEEAELAVRKLKAWKRLKDRGFRFNKWTIPEEPKTPHIKLVIDAEMDVPNSPYDLDLLFGGEE